MKEPSTTVELFTVKEVAAKFRVKPRTVYRWLKAGRMSAITTPGGHLRISGEEVFQEFQRQVEDESDTPPN